jgi:hypothetical protein
MTERRRLTAAVHSVPNADPDVVRAFVTQEKPPALVVDEPPITLTPVTKTFQPVGLIPITVRLSPEIAGALKRASLERQLAGEQFFSQQEIVERALTSWLQKNGHLSPQ